MQNKICYLILTLLDFQILVTKVLSFATVVSLAIFFFFLLPVISVLKYFPSCVIYLNFARNILDSFVILVVICCRVSLSLTQLLCCVHPLLSIICYLSSVFCSILSENIEHNVKTSWGWAVPSSDHLGLATSLLLCS